MQCPHALLRVDQVRRQLFEVRTRLQKLQRRRRGGGFPDPDPGCDHRRLRDHRRTQILPAFLAPYSTVAADRARDDDRQPARIQGCAARARIFARRTRRPDRGMTRRVPIVPTAVVALAALLMVRLGFWQIHRLHEKEALLARYAANAVKPPLPFVALFPVTDESLYRRTSAHCLNVVGWTTEAGRGIDGTSGWRHIASCRTGAEGPGIMVDVGISPAPTTPKWSGGPVRGRLTWAPSSQPLVARLFSAPSPSSPM